MTMIFNMTKRMVMKMIIDHDHEDDHDNKDDQDREDDHDHEDNHDH